MYIILYNLERKCADFDDRGDGAALREINHITPRVYIDIPISNITSHKIIIIIYIYYVFMDVFEEDNLYNRKTTKNATFKKQKKIHIIIWLIIVNLQLL